MSGQRKLAFDIVLGCAGAAAAWVLRLALTPALGDRAPFVTFFPAMFVVAWWSGLRATVVAAVASSLILAYFILAPRGSFAIELSEFQYGLVIFVFVALAAGWLGENWHTAQRAAQAARDQAVEERERLRVTLSSIGDGVIVTDDIGRVTMLNPVAETLTGWKQREASGQPLTAVFHIVNEESRKTVENPCEKVMRTGVVVGLANHTVLIAKDGTELPIDDSAAPIRTNSQHICGVVLVFRDVTEKRDAERRLERSERQLTDFFENSAVPLHWVGPDGTILRANQAELDMMGYTADEYIGRRIADFYVDQTDIDAILTQLAGGNVLNNVETRLRVKDGSIRDVLITSNVLWEDGKFLHTRCFTRDITARKHAERSLAFLADAGATLAALTDRRSALDQAVRLALPILGDWCAAYTLNAKGEIERHAHAHVDADKEQLLGQMLERYALEWSSPASSVAALKSGETQFVPEVSEDVRRHIAQNDEHLAMMEDLASHSVISVPLKVRQQVIGVISFVASDRAERYDSQDVKLAESFALRVATAVDNAQLYHAVTDAGRQKDDFLAMLAHELRNPLAAIRYSAALGQMDSGRDAGELLEIIERQTQNLTRLIDDLLDISRISRDKITLRKEAVDAWTVVTRAVASVRPLMAEKKHELIVETPSVPLPLYADPTRVEQIVANLLTNAAKYTAPGGRVRVKSVAENDHVAIHVQDSGVGMPPEMLGRVFDLFAQADRSLDRSEGGLGIGLTVARRLAEKHGGTVTAASEGLGCGSEFTLRLPMSNKPATSNSARSAPRTESPMRRRVLLVEDNRDTARAAAKLLELLGHEVRVAHDGQEALAIAQEFQPEAMFLDIGLPGMSGYELARRLRLEGFDQATIVAVSGYGQSSDKQRAREAGFDDHLTKPVDQRALISVLAELNASH